MGKQLPGKSNAEMKRLCRSSKSVCQVGQSLSQIGHQKNLEEVNRIMNKTDKIILFRTTTAVAAPLCRCDCVGQRVHFLGSSCEMMMIWQSCCIIIYEQVSY